MAKAKAASNPCGKMGVPSNTVFLVPWGISAPNRTSVRAVVFAGRRRTDRQIFYATGSSVAVVLM